MKTRTRNNPFIPSALALSLMACGLMLPTMGSAAVVKPHTIVRVVKRAPLVRQSVNAPQLLVHLRGNGRISQPLMAALDRLSGTPLHVARATGPGEYQMFTAAPVSVQALQAIAARLRRNPNVLSANVLVNDAPQYLIAQSRQRVVLKGPGLIKSSVPIVHYRWRQIAGPKLRINDASTPVLSTTPTATPSTGSSTPVADPTGINPGDLFAGLIPKNIQPCSSSSSSTPADASATPTDGSTPSSNPPAPGPTFAFSGSFSSSYANRNPDGSVKTGTFATSFSGAWSTDKNGFFCSLNTDPNAGTPTTSTPTTPGDNTSTTPVGGGTDTSGSTPGTTDTSGGTGSTPGTIDTSGGTGSTPGTTNTSGSTGLADPTSGQPAAVGAPLAIDPNTGAYIDPTNGQDMTTDPATGLPMNAAGKDVDPTTGQVVASASPVTASSVRATRAYVQKHNILGFRLMAVDKAGIVHARNVYIHVKPASVRPAAKAIAKPVVRAKPLFKGRTLNPIKRVIKR
jgi:hypothetical protein